MRVFLDFEASSLSKRGYPIEVGWVFEDGRSEAYLIRPAPTWTDWDEEAEAIHGISRSKLAEEGADHNAVAQRMLDELSGHALYASAPSWDGKWLSALFRAAGLPRHALRLRDTEEAQRDTAADLLRPFMAPEELDRAVASLTEAARSRRAQQKPRHRALEDAEAERRTWVEVQRAAEQEVSVRQRLSASSSADAAAAGQAP